MISFVVLSSRVWSAIRQVREGSELSWVAVLTVVVFVLSVLWAVDRYTCLPSSTHILVDVPGGTIVKTTGYACNGRTEYVDFESEVFVEDGGDLDRFIVEEREKADIKVGTP